MKPITKEGFEQVKEKLAQLKKEFDMMPAIIGEAREKGDLKENAEYHSAKERQGMLQAQIAKLESDMGECQVIDPKVLAADLVTFGKTVGLEDLDSGESLRYSILGELESDRDKGEIGVNTPVAKGLLGKKVGDVAEIVVPAGKRRLKIIEITF